MDKVDQCIASYLHGKRRVCIGFQVDKKRSFRVAKRVPCQMKCEYTIIIKKTSVTVYIRVHFNLECVPYIGSALTYRRLEDFSKQTSCTSTDRLKGGYRNSNGVDVMYIARKNMDSVSVQSKSTNNINFTEFNTSTCESNEGTTWLQTTYLNSDDKRFTFC